MSDTSNNNPSARSWRDIPQEITPRAMSREGRRRSTARTMRTIAWVVATLVVTGGGFEIWRTLHEDPQKWAATASSKPVRHVIVETDGVLSQDWVKQTLDLPNNIGLMELDLYSLRARLLDHQQVKSAVLKREFPDTLRVVLQERFPVVRLKARLNGPDVRDFLVAQDGTVFAGHEFEQMETRRLPWLGGVRLVRHGDGFAQLSGIDRVADLLSTARSNTPKVYDTWRVVSLERMARDGQIIVQSSQVPEIIFGLREDFFTQLARLDLILEETMERNIPVMKSIDLSVGARQVPVALHTPLQDGGVPAVHFPVHHR